MNGYLKFICDFMVENIEKENIYETVILILFHCITMNNLSEW